MNTQITAHVCNPSFCQLYPDGKHQWTERISLGTYENGNSKGESAACRCGQDAFSVSIWTGE